ncbi:MAG: leucine-rich repeat domain-containing protein [Candidatus Methanomethylophilaceae archaeon]|nr:leucine-rich repeat domain-containing protein [Candidatus Methanomethylophilaceae archaeon]
MSVSLPDSLVSIGKWAFECCRSLESIRIPASTSKLGEGFYYGCNSLVRIDVDPANRFFFSDRYGMLYESNRQALIRCPKSCVGEVQVAVGTVVVSQRAFEGCCWVSAVRLPASVGVIGKRAFAGCSSLRSFSVPPLVRSIPDNAFANCARLESVSFADSVVKIGCGAFSGCPSLKSIVLPAALSSIGYGAFDEGASITRRSGERTHRDPFRRVSLPPADPNSFVEIRFR